MLLTIVIVLATTLIIAFLLSLVAKKYITRPRFICNTNDDRSVICARIDYERSPHTYTTRSGKVLKLVPESVTILDELDFTDRYKELEASGQISLITATVEHLYPYVLRRPVEERYVGNFYNLQKPVKESGLLVPYSSSSPASQADQENLLTGPRGGKVEHGELDRYLEHRAETERSYCWSKRYLQYYRNSIGYRTVVSLTLIAGSILLMLMSAADASNRRGETTLASITVTDPSTGTVSANTSIKLKDRYGQPMFEDETSDLFLYRGPVKSVTPIGGGLAVVCVAWEGDQKHEQCGTGSIGTGYQVGQTAYVRFFNLKSWSTDKDRDHRPARGIITEAEGNSLLTTGKFILRKRHDTE